MYFTSLLLLVSEREEDNLSGLLTSQHLVYNISEVLKYEHPHFADSALLV